MGKEGGREHQVSCSPIIANNISYINSQILCFGEHYTLFILEDTV